jgi:hypothetical protein
VSSTIAIAQSTRVFGKVIDAQTKETLPFVNILFKGTTIGTTTDIDGKYLIETNQRVDSIMVSYLGYKTVVKPVIKYKAQQINFELEPNSIELKEFVVKAGENPAHIILRNIWKNKKDNDKDKLSYYQYEAYNKIEFDINNIDEEYRNKKMFKGFEFIFDYIDSTGKKPYLPMFITETVSDVYYRKEPKAYREYIKASRVSGVKNESVNQFMGDMYQNINIYDNFVLVFGKAFVSPISTSGLMYYKYYLVDSATIDGKWCYNINFMPKRLQEPTFSGDFWVTDTTFAIKKINLSIGADANINFIRDFSAYQEFNLIDTIWMLTKDQLIVDFNLTNSTLGFYGRKTTSYKNIIINEPAPIEKYKGTENVIVLDDAREKSNEYWETARHDSLSEQEKAIYEMVDSVKNVPRFKSYVEILQMILTGYKIWGKVEFGPYFTTYSFNKVEGSRFRIGGRTSNDFSTRLMLESYLAYGLKDEQFKYGASFIYFLSKKPRFFVGGNFKYDMEQLGQSPNALRQDNILASAFRRNPYNKLTLVEEYKGYIEREWFNGFSSRIVLSHRTLTPKGALSYEYYLPDSTIAFRKNLQTADITFKTRFAYKEKYVQGEFDRVSLGTRYPIIQLYYTYGIKDVLKSDYNFHRATINISGFLRTKPFGYFDYNFETGKIWGKLPYPLLELHNGNETFSYDQYAFNMMNFFEFVSDQYISLMLTHHFNGYFFNKIPLIRKLKLREVVLGKAVYGTLRDENRQELIFPSDMNTLEKMPYVEVGAGIENILRFIRVDGLWRLTYLDKPNIQKFGIRVTYQFNF